MSYFTSQLLKRLEALKWTKYKLAKLSGFSQGAFTNVMLENRAPTDAFIEALAAVPDLGLSAMDMKAWRMIDEFSLEELEAAITEAKKLRAEKAEESTNE
jgi:transcriptional regulator with XRE-family HTH domain